ncbi:unnamed protein product [Acanthoscelides obtectus]|uniref:Uncharacterized protein n=1 Tax=Acanthoscelides obtectus TaxID=200917 RepID=A0A9P0P3H0_ACAOB|nr:unnamed protein product [Acanthoscelides obtectus]CAK1658462.1 hypothetical protein AOBTE_LOCUS20912 [Acanthoscelides obtectus]
MKPIKIKDKENATAKKKKPKYESSESETDEEESQNSSNEGISEEDESSRDMREASLEYIANEMSLVNTSEVTKKIKNLRSTYNQGRAKIEKSKKSGSGSEDVYKSSLKWFDIMDHIMKTINLKEKETTSNLPNDTPSWSKILEDDVSRDIDDKTYNKSIDSSDSSLIKNKNPVQVKNKIKHNITQETSGIAAAFTELKQLNSAIQTSSCSQQCDEYDVIGKHVAIQLRQLPLLDFIDAKDEIQQVLSRYRKKAIQGVRKVGVFLFRNNYP